MNPKELELPIDLKDVPAYGYIRVSTKMQSSEGLSLEFQQEKIEEYCRFRGFRLEKVFIDRGFSGKNLKRPEIKELLHLLKTEKKLILVI